MSVWPIPVHVTKTLIVPTARAPTPAIAKRDFLEMEHLVRVSDILLGQSVIETFDFIVDVSIFERPLIPK